MLNPHISKCQRGSSTKTVPGSTVGKSAISQAISALENWRVNHHHLHKDNFEAQIGLRSDNRIKVIEDAAKRNEPKRVESSQALKAAGTSSGLFSLPPFFLSLLFTPSLLCPSQTHTLLKSLCAALSGA
jgi:hypothetical protein